jgi:long-chain acyl-CoA synthetase
MSTSDPIFDAVTAKGSPFEIGERDGLRQFVNAPPDLNMLIEAARRHGDKTFIVEGERRLSFENVFALRDALVPHLGIECGDRVAICMRNRTEWMIAYLAVIRAGGVAALLNSRGSPAELVGMIEQVEPTLVIADEERSELIRKGGYQGRVIKAEEFPAEGTELPLHAPASPLDPAAILFTSGTGGRAKGAVLSHRALITGLMSIQLTGMMVLHNMARNYNTPMETLLANSPQGATLLVYPLFHISGFGASFLSQLFAGSKIVIMRRWDAGEAMRLIEAEKISQFSAVPTMLWDMINRTDVAKANLSALRNIGSGGQALPLNLVEAVHAACPNAVLGTGYGMTETAGSVAQALGEDFMRRRAAAGRVLPLVDMKIDAPEGEAGEILVRGAMVMNGYFGQPDETAAVLTDGWLRTGDVGYVDTEGYVFIVDRKKDMVISGGENIYCAEVERAMSGLAEVRECAAFGLPDDRLGEKLVAVVVGDDLDPEAIKVHVGEALARYKAPAEICLCKTALPRNHMDKVDKIKLRAMWPALMGETAHADAS